MNNMECFNNTCNNGCENNEQMVPPFDNYYCQQCDEENKPCETCGPQRPKWPCHCCEKDIMCGAPACCRPCWDTCKCMDEILGMKKCADKMKREVNNVNGRVTKVEKDLIDFNDNLSDAIGDLAEKEERDIAAVYNTINNVVGEERDRAQAAERTIQNNLNNYIQQNDNALEAERQARAAADNSERDARIAADNQEKEERIAADNQEKDARIAADNAEREDRIQGDNALDGRINTLNQNLADEITRSTTKDNQLQNALDTEIADRINAINDEARDRLSGDNILQQNINNESDARIEEDEAIRQLIRQVDASLVNYYTKGDTYNKDEVNYILKNIRQFQYKVVPSLPTAGEDTVGFIYLIPSPNPVTQNVKDEFITVSTTDGSVVTYRWEQIGTTTVDLSPYSTTVQMNQAIANAVAAEQARATQKEGDLQSAINTEKNRAQGAETNLQNAIGAEQSRAQGAEQALQNTLNNAISGVSISGNTLTFTRVNGTSFTIDIPRLWTTSGSSLVPIDSSKSVTAAGFYDSTM